MSRTSRYSARTTRWWGNLCPQYLSTASISALALDKGQFLPDGMMPANGPDTVLAVEKLAGKVNGPVDLSKTYDMSFVQAANKLEGFTK